MVTGSSKFSITVPQFAAEDAGSSNLTESQTPQRVAEKELKSSYKH